MLMTPMNGEYKNQVNHGFTIIELLIVIVVIAILAAVTIVSYNGISVRAQNTAVLAEVNAWKKAFTVYRVSNDSWPDSMVVDKVYCLGTNFPNGAGGVARCSDFQSAAAPTAAGAQDLINQLKDVSQVNDFKKYSVENNVGPYVRLCGSWWRCSRGDVLITTIFKGKTGECPEGMNEQWSAGDALWCDVALKR